MSGWEAAGVWAAVGGGGGGRVGGSDRQGRAGRRGSLGRPVQQRRLVLRIRCRCQLCRRWPLPPLALHCRMLITSLVPYLPHNGIARCSLHHHRPKPRQFSLDDSAAGGPWGRPPPRTCRPASCITPTAHAQRPWVALLRCGASRISSASPAFVRGMGGGERWRRRRKQGWRRRPAPARRATSSRRTTRTRPTATATPRCGPIACPAVALRAAAPATAVAAGRCGSAHLTVG